MVEFILNNYYLQAIIISISQITLVFFRTLVVRTVVHHQVFKSVMFTGIIQLAWIVGGALGIKAFLDDNWIMLVIYILSGMLGTYLNFKIKVEAKKNG